MGGQVKSMDSFAKRYLAVLSTIVVIGVAYVLLSSDERVTEINEMLARDTQLQAYPYPFRVLRLEDGVAVMGSPRSAEVPVMQFLRTAFPPLSRTAVDDPAMMAAQQELARVQAHAMEMVEARDDVNAVRWEFDEQWFREHGVFLDF